MMAGVAAGYFCYPWNIADPAVFLDAQAAAGFRHLTVAASYHAGKFIQPGDTRARVYFPEDGTVYFRARAERYGRLEPKIAAITEANDTLAALCAAGTMPIRAWTVLNHNSRLGTHHPDVAARNAWGDPYPYSLCPAHPDVRAYDIALCADLADQYRLESLLLETPGWLTYAHGYHHEFAQVPPDDERDRLMELCFCDRCMAAGARAGLDMASLRRAVCARADALIDEAPEAAPMPDLSGLDRWRASVVTDLCRAIRAAVPPHVAVRIISTCRPSHTSVHREGGDLAAMAAATDGLHLPIYQPSPEEAAADLATVLSRVPDPARLAAILRPGFPDMTDAAQLDATIAAMVDAGIGDLSFYNYGLLPPSARARVQRAVARLSEGPPHG